MTLTVLPALDGRDPLGFLAAVGALSVLSSVDPSTRLSFQEDTALAVIHGRWEGLDDLAAELTAVFERVRAAGELIPGAGTAFPPPKLGSEPDPLRVVPERLGEVVAAADGNDTRIGWLGCLVTDLAVDAAGRVAITPFAAPSGQQSFNSMFSKAAEEVARRPGDRLREALGHWVRVPGFTGEYLDHRVINDAAGSPAGKSEEMGVPGATWLALMALRQFPHAGDGQSPVTTGWQRVRRRWLFVWPVFAPALDPRAVATLLCHPALRLDASGSPDRGACRGLGVFHVGRAYRRRIAGRNFAGVLAPLAPADEARIFGS